MTSNNIINPQSAPIIRLLASALKNTMSRQFRVNMMSGTLCAGLSAVIALSAYSVYLRYLGYDELGLWFILSTVLTVSQFGNLGINAAVTAIVAKKTATEDWEGVMICASTAIALVGTTGTIVFTVALCFRTQFLTLFHLTTSQTKEAAASWVIISMLSCYVYLTDSIQATVSGLGRQDLCNYNQILVQAGTLLTSFLFLRSGFGIRSLVYGSCIGYLISGSFLTACFMRITGSWIFKWTRVRPSQVPPLLRLGGWMLGWSVLNLLFGPLNRVMLARFCGIGFIPVYDVALAIAMRLRSLFEGAIRGMTAEIGRRSASFAIVDKSHTLTAQTRRLLMIIAGPVYLGAIVFATPGLRLWLHGNIHPALPGAFRLLLLATFLSLLGTPSHYAFIGFGHTKTCFIAGALQAGTSAALVTSSAFLLGSISVSVVCVGTIAGMTASTSYLLWAEAKTGRHSQSETRSDRVLATAF